MISWKELKSKCNQLFSNYEGKITVDDENEAVSIVSKNYIKGKKVECYIKCIITGLGWYNVSALEETVELIGGVSCPCYDLEQVEREVDRNLGKYNFVEKKQMNLFEWLGITVDEM